MCLIMTIAPVGIGETTMAEYIIEKLYTERNHKEYMTGFVLGEVIRCKGCKHFKFIYDYLGRCERLNIDMLSIDFCSRGERKDEKNGN